MASPISSVEFKNFKGFRHYTLHLGSTNFLVGTNNSGKSTVISAFRILEAGLRKARSRKPERFLIDDAPFTGYQISLNELDVSSENVHTDYDDVESEIIFRFPNRNLLRLIFPRRGNCYLIPEADKQTVASPVSFERAFPLPLIVVPVLGPLEHDEAFVISSTVQRNLSSSRASRHFRSYWVYNRAEFPKFASLIAQTWRGMSVMPPEDDGQTVQMYCLESRMTRELYWAGFGFQIWCQLVSHLSRAEPGSLVIIDEPEVYLHPDVQRQIPKLIQSLSLSCVIATHSTEIIGQADPSDIVPINKKTRSSKKLRDVAEIQVVLDEIGSIQNLLLSRLARHGCALFFEGDDLQLLRRFASRIGIDLSADSEVTPVKAGGFQSWKRIRELSWGLRKLNLKMRIGAIFDRDYFPEGELAEIKQELSTGIEFARILGRKELENYLLVPDVLCRAINQKLSQKNPPEVITMGELCAILEAITSELHHEVLGQYIAKQLQWKRKDMPDPATLSTEVSQWFSTKWSNLTKRLEIVPGKEVLRRVRQQVQKQYGINLTDAALVACFYSKEVPEDLIELLAELCKFMKSDHEQSLPRADV